MLNGQDQALKKLAEKNPLSLSPNPLFAAKPVVQHKRAIESVKNNVVIEDRLRQRVNVPKKKTNVAQKLSKILKKGQSDTYLNNLLDITEDQSMLDQQGRGWFKGRYFK